MAAGIELLCTVVCKARLTHRAFGTSSIKPLDPDALSKQGSGDINACLNDCADAFVADDGVVRAPGQHSADFRVALGLNVTLNMHHQEGVWDLTRYQCSSI